jgi:hypothetical protein
VTRAALATRLALERQLGKLLAATVKPGKRPRDILVRDDNKNLPEGISRDASSSAQALAEAPDEWFDKVVESVASGDRRPNVKEIYLEARHMPARHSARCWNASPTSGLASPNFDTFLDALRQLKPQSADPSKPPD